jgi:chromatin remodeling complex protein RSC6
MVASKKQKSSTATVEPTAPTEVVVEKPVTTPTVETTDGSATNEDLGKNDAVENPVTTFHTRLTSYQDRVQNITKTMKELVNEGKTLEKEFNSLMKQMTKKTKMVKSNEDRPLSGFAMPSLLSDEMYEFLNLEKGTKVPRKNVTKMINEYIKDNSLRDESDKRKIRPNKQLHQIFKSSDADQITYFNLQSYMKHHFIKDSAAVKAA